MILTKEIEDIQSFFERAFPGLSNYRTEKDKDQKFETVFFNWEKEDYAFCLISKLKIINYGNKIGLVEHVLKKQVEIDGLSKKEEVPE